jgi:hypothetical protein
MSIGVVAIKIIVHGLHYHPGNLGAAGPIEISNRIPIMSAFECRKTFPDFCG